MRVVFSNKKYLVISALTIPYTAGGGIHAFSFARFIAQSTKNVFLLSIDPYGHLNKLEHRNGVDIYRMHVRQGNNFVKLVSYMWMIPTTLRLIIRSDIVIIYGKYFALHRLVIVTARILRKYIVFRSTLMGEDDMDSLLGRNQITRSIRKMVYSGINMYFAITPHFSILFRKHFNKVKLFESPQGVDNRIFFPVSVKRKIEFRKMMNIPPSVTVILSVGSLIARKGYLEIFNGLSEISTPFLYIIAGEKDLSSSPHLISKADEIKETIQRGKELLGSRVRFIGMAENLNGWFNIADIFIHNGVSEGLPNSLLECLSCGTIALIRYINGLEGYLIKNGKNGYQFKDRFELQTYLAKFLKEPSLIPESSNEYAEHIRQKISLDNVYAEFADKISEAWRQ